MFFILFYPILVSIIWVHHLACGNLVPWPRIERRPPQWKCRVLITGPSGNSSKCLLFIFYFFKFISSLFRKLHVFIIFNRAGSSLLHTAFLWLRQASFSLQWFLCCGAWALEHWLSSCDVWTQQPRSMWNLSSQARDCTVSPALAGRFLIIGPPGSSPLNAF